jgi:hypothetical protein
MVVDAYVIDHLKKVVDVIVASNFKDPLRFFESTSIRVREGRITHDVTTDRVEPAPILAPIVTAVDFDYIEYFSVLQSLGVGLDERESVLIAANLTTLRSIETGATVEFWGKIVTTHREDYYIAKVYDELENRFYVMSGLRGEWIELEVPTDHQRKIAAWNQYFFKGELDREVIVCTVFGGTEKVFLAAVVRNIENACSISLANVTGTDISAEVVPSIHCYPGITLNRFIVSGNDHSSRHNWRVEYKGDPNTYMSEFADDEKVTHGFTVVESLAWPGFSFIVSGYSKVCHRVYVGDGISRLASLFFVTPFPPSLQDHYPSQRNVEFIVSREQEPEEHAMTPGSEDGAEM